MTIRTLAAAALLAAASLPSFAADTMNIALQGTSGTVLYTSDTGNYRSGQMSFLRDTGSSFAAFCVETNQDPSSELLSYGVGRFAQPQQNLLHNLYATHFDSLSSDLQRAAFQVAVWEITHEQSGSLDVANGQGSFFFNYFNSELDDLNQLTGFEQLANGYLADAASYSGPQRFEVFRLSHASAQDLVMATPVPEPGTYALMLAGLLAVGYAKRRRG